MRPRRATLPPHITFDEAKKFLMSMTKGDSEAGGVIKMAVKEMVATVLGSKKG